MGYSLKRMGKSQCSRIAMACLLVAFIVLVPIGIDRAVGQEDGKEIDALAQEGTEERYGRQIHDRQREVDVGEVDVRTRYGHSQDAYNRSLAWVEGYPNAGNTENGVDQSRTARTSFSDGLPAWFTNDICDPGECEYAGYSDASGVAGFVRSDGLDATVSWMLAEMSGKGWQCIAQDQSAGHFEFARQNDGHQGNDTVSTHASLRSVHAQLNEVGGCTCVVFMTGDSQST